MLYIFETQKEAFIHGRLKVEKVQKVSKFHQKDCLKSYIDLSTELREKDNDFQKDFYKLMNNSLFGKTIENTGKHWNITSLSFIKEETNQVEAKLLLKKWLPEILGDIEMRKAKVKMNKPAYLYLIKIKFECASFGTTILKKNNYIIVKKRNCAIMIRIAL